MEKSKIKELLDACVIQVRPNKFYYKFEEDENIYLSLIVNYQDKQLEIIRKIAKCVYENCDSHLFYYQISKMFQEKYLFLLENDVPKEWLKRNN